MGTGFREFPQTPRGRGFSLLGLLMFELNEAVSGRLIGSKSWNRGVGFLKPMWTVRDCPRAVWGAMVQNCAMNDALTCKRPEMAVKPRFTK